MAFISLKDFSSIWYFKLIGLIGPRAVSERVNAGPDRGYSRKRKNIKLLKKFLLARRM
jgi:hypothetical protein